MANDMNSAMDALKGILGDDAEEKIKMVMNGLGMAGGSQSSSGSEPIQTNASEVPALPQSTPSFNADSLQYMMKIKNVFDEMSRPGNDARSNLLMSLKPYMRSGRQKSIDHAIRLMNLTKITGFFK